MKASRNSNEAVHEILVLISPVNGNGQVSLHICTGLPGPLLLTYTKYGCK